MKMCEKISAFNISGRKTKYKMLGRTKLSLKFQFLPFKKIRIYQENTKT